MGGRRGYNSIDTQLTTWTIRPRDPASEDQRLLWSPAQLCIVATIVVVATTADPTGLLQGKTIAIYTESLGIQQYRLWKYIQTKVYDFHLGLLWYKLHSGIDYARKTTPLGSAFVSLQCQPQKEQTQDHNTTDCSWKLPI